MSGLEDEFLAAAGKPQLMYVQRPAPNREPRLAEMLDRVARSGVSYRTFAHPKELVALIGGDLALLLSERFGAARGSSHRGSPASRRPETSPTTCAGSARRTGSSGAGTSWPSCGRWRPTRRPGW